MEEAERSMEEEAETSMVEDQRQVRRKQGEVGKIQSKQRKNKQLTYARKIHCHLVSALQCVMSLCPSAFVPIAIVR